MNTLASAQGGLILHHTTSQAMLAPTMLLLASLCSFCVAASGDAVAKLSHAVDAVALVLAPVFLASSPSLDSSLPRLPRPQPPPELNSALLLPMVASL